MKNIRPATLKSNDTIAIVSTARKINPDDLITAIYVFESWGLRIKPGKNLYNQHNQFSGTDIQRLQDFQENLDDPEVKAIICARGGYGTTRIIDEINFNTFANHPKWIAGFSDVTAILCHLHTKGVETIHSIMPLLFGVPGSEAAVESLRRVLFGERISYETPPHSLNKSGVGAGTVIGGNLSILITLIGTASDIDTSGKILFIEDLDEYLYHIDRMMVHLKRAGRLQNLAGLIVGQMTDMKDNAIPFGATAYEIIIEHVKDYSFPVCFDFPVGHVPENMALPCGRNAKLVVEHNKVFLDYEDVDN